MRQVIFVGWATPSEIEEKADLLAVAEADGTYSVVKDRSGNEAKGLNKDALLAMVSEAL